MFYASAGYLLNTDSRVDIIRFLLIAAHSGLRSMNKSELCTAVKLRHFKSIGLHTLETIVLAELLGSQSEQFRPLLINLINFE